MEETMRGAAVAVTVLSLGGCALEVKVGGCDPLRVTEILTSGESLEEDLPFAGTGKMDFIELENVDEFGSDEVLELEGYGIRLDGATSWTELPARTLSRGERVVVVASTYFLSSTWRTEAGVSWTGVGLDLNNDASSFDLLAPDGALCQAYPLPDQHASMSTSVHPEQDDWVWCITAPTPGEENARCLDRF